MSSFKVNISLSIVLFLISLPMLFFGFTLIPKTMTALDGTSLMYSFGISSSAMSDYVKGLLSGGYFIIAPVWVIRVIAMLGIFLFFLSVYVFIHRKKKKPFSCFATKEYWLKYEKIS